VRNAVVAKRLCVSHLEVGKLGLALLQPVGGDLPCSRISEQCGEGSRCEGIASSIMYTITSSDFPEVSVASSAAPMLFGFGITSLQTEIIS
jgi:hypothetical protein